MIIRITSFHQTKLTTSSAATSTASTASATAASSTASATPDTSKTTETTKAKEPSETSTNADKSGIIHHILTLIPRYNLACLKIADVQRLQLILKIVHYITSTCLLKLGVHAIVIKRNRTSTYKEKVLPPTKYVLFFGLATHIKAHSL
mgnify:CR=1 FL=1